MKLRSCGGRAAFVLSLALMLGTAAAEERPSGWYLGAAGGAHWLEDADNVAAASTTPGSGPNIDLLQLGIVVLPPGTPLDSLCTTPLSALLCAPGSAATTTGSSQQVSYSMGPAVMVNLGYQSAGGWRPELSLAWRSNDVDTVQQTVTTTAGSTRSRSTATSGSATSLAAMASVWYDFMADGRLHPYLGAGVGGTRVTYDGFSATFPGITPSRTLDADDSVFAWQAGAGLGYDVSDRLTLSLDYRYLAADDPEFDAGGGATVQSEYRGHSALLGLRYRIGGESAPAEPAPEPAKVVPPCRFDTAGVPAEFLDENGCPLDSDGDGIPDYKDECPHSPAGARVLPDGCALQGDCRRPRPGEEVDANGCALGNRFILRGVKFEFDSARLLPQSLQILQEVAQTLQSYPSVRVEVAGHTDYIGTDAYNQGLSERRANAVRDYLASHGVDAARMQPAGYGESQPIASNETDDGREENRRVEFKVLE